MFFAALLKFILIWTALSALFLGLYVKWMLHKTRPEITGIYQQAGLLFALMVVFLGAASAGIALIL